MMHRGRMRWRPFFEYRKGGNQNTSSWLFEWLFILIWTNDAPALGVNLELDDAGLLVQISLPYVWVRVTVLQFPTSWAHRFWRKPGLVVREAERAGKSLLP